MKKYLFILLTAVIMLSLVTSVCAESGRMFLYREGAGYSTGWWFHDTKGIRDTHSVEITFTSSYPVTGLESYFFASPDPVNIEFSLLNEAGNVIQSVTKEFSGDGFATVMFDSPAPKGRMTLRIASKTDADGRHFVLASAPYPLSGSVTSVVSHVGSASNDAPYISLITELPENSSGTAEPGETSGGESGGDTPETSDIKLYIILTVMLVTLAGAVICKRLEDR